MKINVIRLTDMNDVPIYLMINKIIYFYKWRSNGTDILISIDNALLVKETPEEILELFKGMKNE